MRDIERTLTAALLVALGVAGCATMAPPKDLLSVRAQMKDKQAMDRAKALAPEQVKAAAWFHARAEEACANEVVADCEHFSEMARWKLATASEHVAQFDAIGRRETAEARTQQATETANQQDERRWRSEGRIAKMERIAGLQQRVARATSDADAERARLALEREKADRARAAFATQQTKLDKLADRDMLFGELVTVAGAENVKRTSRGIVVTLRSLFAPGKSEVGPDKSGLVDAAAALVVKYTGYPVVVEGYTDARGRSASNLALSQSRAQAVMSRILSANVPMSRVKAVGYGQQRPISDNSTAAGREINRRIEIVFLF